MKIVLDREEERTGIISLFFERKSLLSLLLTMNTHVPMKTFAPALCLYDHPMLSPQSFGGFSFNAVKP
jgi:hypothetical protein